MGGMGFSNVARGKGTDDLYALDFSVAFGG